MIEVIDHKTNHKFIAMILCSICYKGDCYIIYAIQRGGEDANVFVSKLVQNSQGYVMNFDFENGEKKLIENIVQRFINREDRSVLEHDGLTILDDIKLDELRHFDIDNCYVSTVSKSLIKNCLIHYGLVNERLFDQPVVDVVDDKRKFNDGFASNVVLIIFGLFILIFSGFVIFGVLFG